MAENRTLPPEVLTELDRLSNTVGTFPELDTESLDAALRAAWRMGMAYGRTRLELAEFKLKEMGIHWDGEKYAYNGED